MNLLIRVTLTIVCFSFGFSLIGQNWSKLKKEGDMHLKNGFYQEAGDAYYKAWKEKPEKLELAWQAGNAYYTVKEYGKAAESLKPVAHWNQPDKLAGLKYARALKQDGQHLAAIAAYDAFRDNYKGVDESILRGIADMESEGSRQALARREDEGPYNVVYPGKTINSEAGDFAPAIFGDEVVYFSSTRSGKAELYRSQAKSGKWGKPDIPKTLPTDETRHVANGAFSENGQLFYFTLCNQPSNVKEQRARCDIYVMNKRGNGWSPPQKLPEYINMQESTQTHPASSVIGDKEYLFFTSDRNGGQGGMDIWYVYRQAGSKSLDFSAPQNAGNIINTMGDEQTPFYDAMHQILYFSSNGHVGFGGLDIYKVSGTPAAWNQIEHPGRPLNSESDDFYFKLNATATAGFLTSNRKVTGQRHHTQDEDLFFVSAQSIPLIVTGDVVDRMGDTPLDGARIFMYRMENNEKVIFLSEIAKQGKFHLTLPNNVDAWLTAEVPEYEPAVIKLDRNKAAAGIIQHTFRLNAITLPDEKPAIAARQKPKPAVVEPAPKAEIPKDAPEWSAIPEENKQVVASPPQPEKVQDEIAFVPTPPAKENLQIPVNEPQAEKVTTFRSSEEARAHRQRMTPYQNKINLAKNEDGEAMTQYQPKRIQPKEEPVVATITKENSQEAASTETATGKTKTQSGKPINSIGTSAPDLSDFEVSGVFTGEGLDKRYNGKRVDKVKYLSETKKREGIYYRIQIEATDRPDPTSRRYAGMREWGEIETERLDNQRTTRMLVGIFDNLQEALIAQEKAHSYGFKRAFVVRYEDGIRLRRWK